MDEQTPANTATPKLIVKQQMGDEYALLDINETKNIVYYEDVQDSPDLDCLLNQEILSPPIVDIQVGIRRDGLSSEEAAK